MVGRFLVVIGHEPTISEDSIRTYPLVSRRLTDALQAHPNSAALTLVNTNRRTA